jgi:hypothetical protein
MRVALGEEGTHLLQFSQELLELDPVVSINDPRISRVEYFFSEFLVYLI